MASLINAINNKDLFKNKQSVQKVTNQRNELTNSLISKLKVLIEDHKQREASLLRPEQIPNCDDF